MRRWSIGIGVIAFTVLAAWILGFEPPRFRPSTSSTEQIEAQRTRDKGWIPRNPVETTKRETEACSPHAARVCLDGDAMWVDSCGEVEGQAEACGERGCVEGSCREVDVRCQASRTRWACSGATAQGCSAGRYFEIDCEALGKRCVMTEEGPACRAPATDPCDRAMRPTCSADELRWCDQGQTQRLDCARLGATCQPGRGGTPARCVRDPSLAGGDDPQCGPCGCPPQFDDEERCDGVDNDGDGFVDEHVECEAIPVQPFLVIDDDGGTPIDDAGLEVELARLQATFAREDGLGLTFAMLEPQRLDRPAWARLAGDELQRVLRQPPAGSPGLFAVPVLFVDTLLVDEVPRPGLATPPNGTCGGHRRIHDPQPPRGIVIIAKDRWPTTLAHEIGHYFGLCHTHQDSPDALETRDDDGERCDEPCTLEGDGVCDTPPDPGPPACELVEGCRVTCSSGSARPEATNVMAYYPPCRAGFTVGQAQTIRRGLALRRAWAPCLAAEGCPCNPLEADACPEQMTCREYRGGTGPIAREAWRCGLDGATVPGGSCQSPRECGHGSSCVILEGQGRCVRPCSPLSPRSVECACESFEGVPTPLCSEDFGDLLDSRPGAPGR